MDYGFSERRKNRNDKKAKRRFNRFRQGGHFRTSNVNEMNSKEEKK